MADHFAPDATPIVTEDANKRRLHGTRYGT